MSESNVESLVIGQNATARLGRTTVHGRVVGLPANGTNFPLVAIQPEGATVTAYVDCWITEGWVFTPGDPELFETHDGSASPEALTAWDTYSDIRPNFDRGPWLHLLIEQNAFTAGWDARTAHGDPHRNTTTEAGCGCGIGREHTSDDYYTHFLVVNA